MGLIRKSLWNFRYRYTCEFRRFLKKSDTLPPLSAHLDLSRRVNGVINEMTSQNQTMEDSDGILFNYNRIASCNSFIFVGLIEQH